MKLATALLAFLAGMAMAGVAAAQTSNADSAAGAGSSASGARIDEIVRRQQMSKQDFEKLTGEMLKLAEEMENDPDPKKRDPDSAKVLREAVGRARGAYEISKDMDQVAELLMKGMTELASRTQGDVITKLEKIIQLLREGILDVDRRMEKVNQWAEAIKNIDEMIKRQQALERSSALHEQADAIKAQMQAMDAAIAGLIAEQEKLKDQTQKLEPGDPGLRKLSALRDSIGKLMAQQESLKSAAAAAQARDLPVVGKSQGELSDAARDVRKEMDSAAQDKAVRDVLSRIPASQPASQPAAASSRPTSQPTSQPGDALASAGANMQSAAGEMGKAAESLEASAAQQAAGSQDAALSELRKAHDALSRAIEQASVGTPAGKLSQQQKDLSDKTAKLNAQVKQAGEKVGESAPNLSTAGEQMSHAADQLSGQNSAAAQNHQDKAIAELKKKRDELAELHRKVQQDMLKPLEKQAGEQGDLANRGQKAAEQMKGSDGQPNSPGQGSMQDASGSMSKASGQLGKSDSGGANASQKKAIEQMQKARDELDKAIAREREMLQAESLAKIDGMIELILVQQKAVGAGTTHVYALRGADGYARQDQVKLADLSSSQKRLGGEVQKVADMLAKEGTTVVFPSILKEICDDMENIAKLLADQQAGPLTQAMQQGVERNLQDLLDALRDELSRRKRQSSGGSGGGGGGSKQPLVPPMAELKMIRSLQMQINARTTVLAEQTQAKQITPAQSQEQHKSLSQRQEQVEAMTRKIGASMRGPGRQGEGEDEP